MNGQEILQRLEELDAELYLSGYQGERIQMIIVGGSALLLHRCIQRSTHDVDILYSSISIHRELLERYDLNTSSSPFLGHFSDTLDQRLILIPLHTICIDYYIPSLEDLIISKLTSDRGKDTEDIKQSLVYEKASLEKLQEIMSEIHLVLHGRRLESLLYEIKDFIERKEKYDHEKTVQ